MSRVHTPIYFVSGPPGAGKSTISRALLCRFERGIHVSVDSIRAMVVSGMAHPIPEWTDETTRQMMLARDSACEIASRYFDARFAVAVDDVLYEEAFRGLLPHLHERPVRKVVLLPTVEMCVHRNRTREPKWFDPSILEKPIRAIHKAIAAQNTPRAGWKVIDSTHQSVEETVDEILREAF